MIPTRHRSTPRATLAVLSALLVAVACAAVSAAGEGSGGHAAFERLKSLSGTWKGSAPGHDGKPMDVTHVIRLSANGSVVMETMFPGTDHEMVNMYHMDGDDLVLTHYCAAGNQPRMKLAPSSTTGDLVFDFAGGSNLDPAKDEHIHSARLVLRDQDTVESSWVGWNRGREAETMRFELRRAKD